MSYHKLTQRTLGKYLDDDSQQLLYDGDEFVFKVAFMRFCEYMRKRVPVHVIGDFDLNL